ncbi:hypothetical protein C3E77_11355 [Mycetocola zhujimingii]|nr:hypothetical protein C3E77_11355 [Mycetocola zhujimingii]
MTGGGPAERNGVAGWDCGCGGDCGGLSCCWLGWGWVPRASDARGRSSGAAVASGKGEDGTPGPGVSGSTGIGGPGSAGAGTVGSTGVGTAGSAGWGATGSAGVGAAGSVGDGDGSLGDGVG